MKKNLFLLLIVTFMISSIVYAGGKKDTNDAKKLEITVVYHDTGIEFGQIIRNGAMAAGKEFGVKVNWVGPIGINVDEQVNFIENAITTGVSGLAISNVNGEALNPMINKAIDAGIPTVTFNSEAAGSKSLAFFGQDLVQSGKTEGEILSRVYGNIRKSNYHYW